ncbi:MAG: hypothetical protein OZSIB_0711 [Candidatus Ozemobacter sibiricus]|jgi:hypothetical protein|uniref:Uncharacterized protein n=1 Tax=Candidatus Ozemobacter sibiricus TaxID=2268124 RepID=A0A367ZUQ3_9BACT|nr:MAG: hypothetical protein OZSIB_0711 [Candidatus Ozemobacter sibiricus]
MAANKIQELVTSFMQMVGITATHEGNGIWRARIPAAERAFFNGFEELSFTFDRAVAEKHRDLELIAEGSYLLKKIVERLVGIPKVSRLFKMGPPELPSTEASRPAELRLITPGKAYYRQQVVFNFKVAFLADDRRERLFSVLADPARHELYLNEGLGGLDPTQFREDPEPGLPIDESGADLLRLYLQACRQLETIIGPEVAERRARNQQRFQAEFERYREFLEEQKRELLKKKENVCFHLYFFQKEEEIDKMIRDLEAEHERKVAELEEKYRLKVEVSLINAIVLCIPTVGAPAAQARKKTREGVPLPLAMMGPARQEVRPAV